MKTVGKGLLCVVLLVLAGFCFSRFRVEYNRPDSRSARFAERDPGTGAPLESSEAPTNAVATVGTNSPAGTNEVAGAAVDTNAAPASVDGTNNAPTKVVVAAGSPRPKPAAAKVGQSSATYYLAGFVLALVGLAGLAGWEITQWVANRTTRVLGADAQQAEQDPEYDVAEAEWAKGNHLDAINLLREYLNRNPSQQHVAIRIAEIYEKDLNNFLAAALELEEVLTKRLPREKWGWTAVHLANIYSGRLNQPDKAIATLERLAKDYPETAAAKKARQRLGIPEPVELPAGEMAAEDLPAPEDPGNLPQGFRSKKK